VKIANYMINRRLKIVQM